MRDPPRRAYNRTAHLAERRVMMQSRADYFGKLKANDSSSKVVPIVKRTRA